MDPKAMYRPGTDGFGDSMVVARRESEGAAGVAVVADRPEGAGDLGRRTAGERQERCGGGEGGLHVGGRQAGHGQQCSSATPLVVFFFNECAGPTRSFVCNTDLVASYNLYKYMVYHEYSTFAYTVHTCTWIHT